jgi:glycosyltransferase involved in cell wall biosynthesis
MSKCVNQHALRVLLVHPGTQHAPRLAATLEKRGLLWRFWTGVAQARDAGERLGARGKRNEGEGLKARGKRVVDIPREKLRTIPWVEVMALLLARLPVNREKVWHWRNGVFQKLVPRREIESADVVVGFDTSSWIIGERAKRAGKKFVLDQSVGHPLSRAKAVREAGGDEEMWPQAFGARLEMVSKAEALEHELADVVVAASSFSKKTLVENGVPEGKIRVIPYGVGGEFLQAGAAKILGTGQEARGERGMGHEARGEGLEAGGQDMAGQPLLVTRHTSHVTGSFRFLYAGYLTKRKGIDVLLSAWSALQNVEQGAGSREQGARKEKKSEARGKGLEDKGNGLEALGAGLAELRLVGGGERPEPLPAGVVCLGQTPREALLGEMSEADVFVFPSLFEGFALVILEAMAAGLPVITTPNTAGPDLIENGKEGLIVPAGDANALRLAMESLLNDSERARSMGRAAHEKAKEYTWERYGERWGALVRELCREQA